MKRARQTSLTLAAAALLLALGAASALTARARSTLAEQIEFKRETMEHDYELNSPKGADEARLKIWARVRQGEITWSLVDPEGEQRLSGHGKRGRISGDTGDLETPLPGIWLLRIGLEDATGSYGFAWESE